MTIKLEYQREIARTIRGFHRLGLRSALVAGGVVRDAYFNQKMTDVDLYVWHPIYSNESVAIKDPVKIIAKAMFGIDNPANLLPYDGVISNLFEDDENAHSGTNHTKHMIEIYNVLKNLVPYQIMFISIPPMDFVMNQFHVGLSRATFDGEKIHYSSDFLHDADNKLLTVVDSGLKHWQFERVMTHYLPKIKTKYPDHQIVIAPENEHLHEWYLKQIKV